MLVAHLCLILTVPLRCMTIVCIVQQFRENHRSSSVFNHLSAISESIPALGWVAVVCPIYWIYLIIHQLGILVNLLTFFCVVKIVMWCSALFLVCVIITVTDLWRTVCCGVLGSSLFVTSAKEVRFHPAFVVSGNFMKWECICLFVALSCCLFVCAVMV